MEFNAPLKNFVTPSSKETVLTLYSEQSKEERPLTLMQALRSACNTVAGFISNSKRMNSVKESGINTFTEITRDMFICLSKEGENLARNLYNHARLTLLIQLGCHFFPYITPVLIANNIIQIVQFISESIEKNELNKEAALNLIISLFLPKGLPTVSFDLSRFTHVAEGLLAITCCSYYLDPNIEKKEINNRFLNGFQMLCEAQTYNFRLLFNSGMNTAALNVKSPEKSFESNRAFNTLNSENTHMETGNQPAGDGISILPPHAANCVGGRHPDVEGGYPGVAHHLLNNDSSCFCTAFLRAIIITLGTTIPSLLLAWFKWPDLENFFKQLSNPLSKTPKINTGNQGNGRPGNAGNHGGAAGNKGKEPAKNNAGNKGTGPASNQGNGRPNNNADNKGTGSAAKPGGGSPGNGVYLGGPGELPGNSRDNGGGKPGDKNTASNQAVKGQNREPGLEKQIAAIDAVDNKNGGNGGSHKSSGSLASKLAERMDRGKNVNTGNVSKDGAPIKGNPLSGVKGKQSMLGNVLGNAGASHDVNKPPKTPNKPNTAPKSKIRIR